MIPRPLVASTLLRLAIGRRGTREALERFQSRALRRIVEHAYERIPFYRRLYDEHGVLPRHVRGIADLSRLPFVEKVALRACDPRELVPQGVDPDSLISSVTSGTSGVALEVRRTWIEQSLMHTFRLRAMRDFGYRPGWRIASIRLHGARHPRDNKMLRRSIRALRLQPELAISITTPLPEIAEILRAYRPQVLRGYAGHLPLLASWISEHAPGLIRPRLVLAGAEVLAPEARAHIERTLGAPVRNWYGALEFDLVGWECGATGNMHLCDENIVSEVLRDDVPALPGEEGELVTTGLHTYAMPLIRYRLGDMVVQGARGCACGAPFTTVREVRGRVWEYFTLPDGRAIHPVDIVEDMRPEFGRWVHRWQIVQERPERIVVKMVTSGHDPERHRRALECAARVVGPGVTVEVREVDEIPPGPGGKLRFAFAYRPSAETRDATAAQAAP